MQVRFIEEAEAELIEASAYYEHKKSGLGLRFVREIRSAIARIKDSPLAWQTFGKRTRRCQTEKFPYSVVYQVCEDEILVVVIAHQHRKPNYWQQRLSEL